MALGSGPCVIPGGLTECHVLVAVPVDRVLVPHSMETRCRRHRMVEFPTPSTPCTARVICAWHHPVPRAGRLGAPAATIPRDRPPHPSRSLVLVRLVRGDVGEVDVDDDLDLVGRPVARSRPALQARRRSTPPARRYRPGSRRRVRGMLGPARRGRRRPGPRSRATPDRTARPTRRPPLSRCQIAGPSRGDRLVDDDPIGRRSARARQPVNEIPCSLMIGAGSRRRSCQDSGSHAFHHRSTRGSQGQAWMMFGRLTWSTEQAPAVPPTYLPKDEPHRRPASSFPSQHIGGTPAGRR